jgi:hypothetical protein
MTEFVKFLTDLLAGDSGAAALRGLLFYLTAMLGAIITYLFASTKGLESTVPKLKQLFPGKTETFYYRLDFFLVVIIGSIVGYIFFAPTQTIQALASGCGWVGALNLLLQQKPQLPSSITGAPSQPTTSGARP